MAEMSGGQSAESDAGLTKRPDESQTEFTVRCIRAEAWEQGYRSGFSNAMRRMSDEPNAPTTPNPYRPIPPAKPDHRPDQRAEADEETR